jgi:2,4-dienoyl-CoA reductase-like NADH-dependent reductase (Old Yellow Enzyme family)
MTESLLFTPIQLRDVCLKNRIVVAPMHQYAAVKGFATDWHLVNAGRFAAGGAGLVIMESTKVERRGCGTLGDLGLWKDEFIPGLKRCVDFIRTHGAVPGIQIAHSAARPDGSVHGKGVRRSRAHPTSTTGRIGNWWRRARSTRQTLTRYHARSCAMRSPR